jgi:hypothetical protein
MSFPTMHLLRRLIKLLLTNKMSPNTLVLRLQWRAQCRLESKGVFQTLTVYGIDPLPWRKTFATYPPFLPIDSLLATLLPSTRYLVNPRIRHIASINHRLSGRALGTARRVSEHYLDSRRVRQLSREALATRDSAPEYLDRPPEGLLPQYNAHSWVRYS